MNMTIYSHLLVRKEELRSLDKWLDEHIEELDQKILECNEKKLDDYVEIFLNFKHEAQEKKITNFRNILVAMNLCDNFKKYYY